MFFSYTGDFMKILKFKKISKGKYKLLLDNNTSITLYEDVIIKNNLLITKEIKKEELESLMKENNNVHVYGMALNYVSVRMRSIKEMKDYLKRKEVNEILIEKIVDKLIKSGYLNDFNFAKAYVNDQLLIINKGPLKIKNELIKLGVSNEIICEVIDDIDNNILKEKLSNLMEKQVKLKKGSLNSIKLKLVNYFVNLGYDKEMILQELSTYNLKSDPIKLKKDYEMLYNKYKNKYEGSSLTYFISQKLYSKGYTIDDIKKVMRENNYE